MSITSNKGETTEYTSLPPTTFQGLFWVLVIRPHRPTHYGGGLVAKSCLTLATSWTLAQQAPLSMGFPKQEYCSGLPFPSPRNLPDPGAEPGSLALQADSLPTKPQGSPYPLQRASLNLSPRNMEIIHAHHQSYDNDSGPLKVIPSWPF